MIKTEALNVLIEAIKFCNSIGLWGCIYNEDLTDSVEFHNFQEKKLDFNIALDNKIEICREDDFDEEGNEFSVTNVGDFVCLYSNIEEYEIINTSIVYGSKMALFLVDASDDFTTVKLINLPYLDDWCYSTVCVDGEEYTVEFISKRQAIFDILLVKDQNFDKDVPFSVCDYFIKVSAKNKIDRKVAENLAEAFIFELSTNHNILLTHATRVTKFNLDSIEVTENSCKKLLPLLTGNGISEVIRLYNQAITFDSFDYQILTFTKIIEYIAPTVARE